MINSVLCDATLVSQYKLGNEEAFEVLLQRYKSKVYSSIYLIVKDSYVAEDLMQDTFVKCVDTIRSGRYNEEGKFAPWIMRIAHNLAIDAFRKQKRNPTIRMEDGQETFAQFQFAEKGIDEHLSFLEKEKQIRAFIKQLPEAQREVLTLRIYGDLSFQEIADLTGVSINTSLGRMRYALINLRKMIEKRQTTAYDKNFYSQ
jgi:RNA polymerase sigma factor (sigma-70 family)